MGKKQLILIAVVLRFLNFDKNGQNFCQRTYSHVAIFDTSLAQKVPDFPLFSLKKNPWVGEKSQASKAPPTWHGWQINMVTRNISMFLRRSAWHEWLIRGRAGRQSLRWCVRVKWVMKQSKMKDMTTKSEENEHTFNNTSVMRTFSCSDDNYFSLYSSSWLCGGKKVTWGSLQQQQNHKRGFFRAKLVLKDL